MFGEIRQGLGARGGKAKNYLGGPPREASNVMAVVNDFENPTRKTGVWGARKPPHSKGE